MVATPTTTPVGFENASTGFANAMDASGAVVLVVYVLVALVAAQLFLPWLARSNLLSGAARRFIQSLEYAIKGVAASVVVLAIGAPVWLAMQADSGTRMEVIRWAAYVVGGYMFLVLAGWLADRAVAMFFEAHPDYDGWTDMFPDEPEVDVDEGAVD